MENKKYLIVTSISEPNESLKALAKGCKENDFNFLLIGDSKSPDDFQLSGCRFYDIKQQKNLNSSFAEACPEKHYARKNIGYLIAISEGASVIKETDDDNFPLGEFWEVYSPDCCVRVVENCGWVNVYRYFSGEYIWPRGFALEEIKEKGGEPEDFRKKEVMCPVQQGLADENPDVDALYRLLFSLPQSFLKNNDVAIGSGSWCPFNSQNTVWYPSAFPLLYLPSFCSFRMTDIWRSFVAQKILHINDQAVLYRKPDVVQRRNEHDLLKDFEDEIIGYLNNGKILREFDKLSLKSGVENIRGNMILCYEKLIEMSLVGEKELDLLGKWFDDLEKLGG